MKAEERRKRIQEYLSKAEFASLEELSRHVSASPSTIRRDLNLLESGGNIRRTHGGACLVNLRSDDYVFAQRETVQLLEKEAIARACAQLIQPGQSVIIDAGTTAFQVARQLEDKALQIITNSLPVANFFASTPNVEVIVSGGVIYPRLGVLVGPLAVEVFTRTHADVAIMSGGGITPEGVTNSHALLIDIQRAMIEGASRVIFCFDHTKVGRRSVAHLCDLASIDTVVTDAGAPPEIVAALRQAGLEVLLAGETTSLVQSPESELSDCEPSKDNALSPSPSNKPAAEPVASTTGDLSGGMSWD
ncbi:MAG TPA: DeoR/GlpR family DNA-binding transcription regulator [Verrucomicrobiae bacterium]|nr:DeoR/GlpR family DNA-binding transcription regulator [Verrucomicrobiae bacterium]